MMMRPLRILALMLVALCGSPGPAAAWGLDVHKFIMARAIGLLPPEIRPFFQKYEPSIVERAIDPDLWRTVGWIEEPPRHFVDMDAYGPYPFKALPHDQAEAVKRYGAAFVEKNGKGEEKLHDGQGIDHLSEEFFAAADALIGPAFGLCEE